jgi:hypothetical protein
MEGIDLIAFADSGSSQVLPRRFSRLKISSIYFVAFALQGPILCSVKKVW